jgi:hypothetical protein
MNLIGATVAGFFEPVPSQFAIAVHQRQRRCCQVCIPNFIFPADINNIRSLPANSSDHSARGTAVQATTAKSGYWNAHGILPQI